MTLWTSRGVALAVESPLAVDAEFSEEREGLARGVRRKELWLEADWLGGESARFEDVEESLGLLILLILGLKKKRGRSQLMWIRGESSQLPRNCSYLGEGRGGLLVRLFCLLSPMVEA